VWAGQLQMCSGGSALPPSHGRLGFLDEADSELGARPKVSPAWLSSVGMGFEIVIFFQTSMMMLLLNRTFVSYEVQVLRNMNRSPTAGDWDLWLSKHRRMHLSAGATDIDFQLQCVGRHHIICHLIF